MGVLPEAQASLAERLPVSPSPVLIDFEEAPLAGGALRHFFLNLHTISLEVTLVVTLVAPPGFSFKGPHGLGHLHLQNRIVWHSLFQITGYVNPSSSSLGSPASVELTSSEGRVSW